MFVLRALTVAMALVQPQPAGDRFLPEKVFLEAWRITENAFFDPDMNGADWKAVRDELQPKAAAARDEAELSGVINEALSRLKASHTGHFTRDHREYYEILDIFYPEGVPARAGSRIEPGPVEYTGIGLAAKRIDGKTFALDVYSGGPADKAGILPGDELVAVEGGPWGDIAPFRGREGEETRVTVRRTPEPNVSIDIIVRPRVIKPRELFLSAITYSARIYERADCKVAYVRIRSYAHRDYHDRLKQLLGSTLKDADALIIDIRGGWGGASPEYMDIFNPVTPELTHMGRGGSPSSIRPTWSKPVAMLIDGGSRSGKEMLAFAFKKHKVGVLVGETTAGAVLGGTARPLSDGSLLFIAVTDIRIDGQKLEGVGVSPDVEVARNLPYIAGKDPQLEAALAAMAEAVKR